MGGADHLGTVEQSLASSVWPSEPGSSRESNASVSTLDTADDAPPEEEEVYTI